MDINRCISHQISIVLTKLSFTAQVSLPTFPQMCAASYLSCVLTASLALLIIPASDASEAAAEWIELCGNESAYLVSQDVKNW